MDESGFSRLDEINPTTIPQLGLAWSLVLDGEVSLEATPLEIHGVIYFTGSYSSVYAVNAANGKLLWKYDPKVWQYSPAKFRDNLGVNRGGAYADGRIFSGDRMGASLRSTPRLASSCGAGILSRRAIITPSTARRGCSRAR